MKCGYMKGYECEKYGNKCVAYFRRETGKEGINENILRISDCYDGLDKVIFAKVHGSEMASVSGALLGE